jgi:predicted lysophospholipase L1 biosynthesis ABC-type transport system permease subunit
MARIRFALRTLAKSPLLSLVVILSLGLGIGANTAIFSLLHQIVLASLPVEKPEQLVLITSPGDFKDGRSSSDNSGGSDYVFSYPMFRELEKQAQIGIRMALGAGPGRILSMVLREMLWIVGIGLTAGIAIALSVTRFAESQLYGVKPRDAMVVVAAALALTATAVAACYLPARRAAKVNPLDALHYE